MGSTTKKRLCFGPCICYRLQTKSRKGNVFTSGCQEFCPQDVCVSQNALGRGLCIITCTGGVCPGVADVWPGVGLPGGVCPGGLPKRGVYPRDQRQTPPPLPTATAADGTHPTGMYSCF